MFLAPVYSTNVKETASDGSERPCIVASGKSIPTIRPGADTSDARVVDAYRSEIKSLIERHQAQIDKHTVLHPEDSLHTPELQGVRCINSASVYLYFSVADGAVIFSNCDSDCDEQGILSVRCYDAVKIIHPHVVDILLPYTQTFTITFQESGLGVNNVIVDEDPLGVGDD